MKWVGLTAACVLLVIAAGCDNGPFGSCSEERPVVLLPDGLEVAGAGPVAVHTALKLQATFVWDSGFKPTQSEEIAAQMSLQWFAEPADGAAVSSSGVFRATKPGIYLVTAQRGGPSATTKVYVTEAGSTTTPEDTDEETTSTETTEEITTTETTVANSLAGTYKGSWLWTAGQSKADVPWAFVLDDRGNLNGGFDCMLTADTRVVCVLTGRCQHMLFALVLAAQAQDDGSRQLNAGVLDLATGLDSLPARHSFGDILQNPVISTLDSQVDEFELQVFQRFQLVDAALEQVLGGRRRAGSGRVQRTPKDRLDPKPVSSLTPLAQARRS